MTTDAASWGGVQITVLADNTADLPFVSEHGFAAVIDICGEHTHRILFDTGRGALFANAPAAGVDLNLCEALVLSHGHYDHTDALPEFHGPVSPGKNTRLDRHISPSLQQADRDLPVYRAFTRIPHCHPRAGIHVCPI